MIVVMRPTVGENTINFVKSNLEKCGVEVNVSQGGTYCILGLVGDSSKIDPDKILTYEGVEKVLKVSEYIRDYKIIDEKDGIVDVQAKTATKEDIRDNLFFEFAEEKLPIIKMERESLSLEDVFLKLTGQDVEEVESEAKRASEQIEKQGHHGFSFKRKKKADSKGTEQAETAEEDK